MNTPATSTTNKMDEKSATTSSSEPPPKEYMVIVPENGSKQRRYSILQFNGPLNVDPGHWPQMNLFMAREDNRGNTTGPAEIVQEFGEGSEYGKAAREEARRKKYGRQTKLYQHDQQPWKLLLKDSNPEKGKERWFRSVREGGAGSHSDYWVFLKAHNNFHAHKVDDWYRFMPNPQNKALDIDQAEEQFQQRNRVLNQFALKSKVQQILRDQDEDGGGNTSKPISLKIKDEVSSDDEENERDDKMNEDEQEEKTLKKKVKKKPESRPRRDKKQRVENANEIVAYESEDGEDEGREYDYISDSGSDTSREDLNLDEKIDQAMVAVGDETGMRDDVSDEEDSEEENGDDKDEASKQKRQLLKKLTGQQQKEESDDDTDDVRSSERADRHDSSGSETDDPDNPEFCPSVLFLQAKAPKRPAEDGDQAIEDEPPKRLKPASREQTPQTSTGPPQSTLPVPATLNVSELNENIVRNLLMQRPMSTKDLVTKLRPKMQNMMTKQELVTRLANILGVLKPEQTHRLFGDKKVLYFSLNKKA